MTTRYHGRPCNRCGGTERLTSNYKCVTCKARRRSEMRAVKRALKTCRLCGEAPPKSITATYCETCSVLMEAERKRINAALYVERHRIVINARRRVVTRAPCILCGDDPQIYHSRFCRLCARAYTRLYHRLYGDGMVATNLELERIKALVPPYRTALVSGLVVDHIVPPGGCRVCARVGGLDDPTNLQVLSAEHNAGKRDRCQECWEADRG